MKRMKMRRKRRKKGDEKGRRSAKKGPTPLISI
jgi:hypothetical protein